MIIKKTDKIFLAGHTGLVGRAVFRKLQDKGFKKVIIKKKKSVRFNKSKKNI